MSFDLDWNILGTNDGPQKRLPYNSVSHMFRKIAWDAYKPLSGPDQLWELREEADGNKYLYAIYSEAPAEDIIITASIENKWSAHKDHNGQNITLSFQNIPIKRFAGVDYGFDPNEADDFAAYLQTNAQDGNFISKLIQTLPEAKKVAIATLLNKSEA